MSTHFTFFHVVLYYTGLSLTIYSSLIIVNCILYYELVSSPQYYDYVGNCIFIIYIISCDFAFAAKFLLCRML